MTSAASRPRAGHIEAFDREEKLLRMSFKADRSFDNGNGQVMGGFLSAMMDVTVAQAAVVQSQLRQTVSTLEQKASRARAAGARGSAERTAGGCERGRAHTVSLRIALRIETVR